MKDLFITSKDECYEQSYEEIQDEHYDEKIEANARSLLIDYLKDEVIASVEVVWYKYNLELI